jgi:hypothetical protein
VQITVRSEDCLAGEEPVFHMDYEGVNNGYLCNGGTTVSLQPEGTDCTPIEGFGAIVNTKFYNLHICGRRGGKSFNEVQRPDIVSKKCPEGTVSCSSTTSIQTTLCYPASEIATSCPIVFIKFVSPTLLPAYQNNAEYTIQPFSSMYFVTTKTQADSLPITKTAIQTKPCMLATEGSGSPLTA